MCFTFMTAIIDMQVSPISNGGRLILEFVTQVVWLKIKHLISHPPGEEGEQRLVGPIQMGGGVREDNETIYVASLKQVSHPCSYPPKERAKNKTKEMSGVKKLQGKKYRGFVTRLNDMRRLYYGTKYE